MNYLHRPNRIIITGRSGTGKTEFFIQYVFAIEPDYQNIFIFDHEGEFAHRTGLQLVSTADQLQAYKGGIQCFDSAELYPGDLQTGFEFYADYAFQTAERSDGQSLFCCDELQKLISTDDIPIDVAKIIETGRRYQIDTLLVTQQVNLIHNRLRNQATEVCTFQQNDERALKWLEQFGFDEQQIRNLQEGQYICRLQSGEETTGNIFGGAPMKTEQQDQEVDGNSDVDNQGTPDSSLSEDNPESTRASLEASSN